MIKGIVSIAGIVAFSAVLAVGALLIYRLVYWVIRAREALRKVQK